MGAPTVGLCGFDGGQLARLAGHALHIPNSSMPQAEDAHSTICHTLAVGLGKRVDALWSAGTPAPAAAEPPLLERSVGLQPSGPCRLRAACAARGAPRRSRRAQAPRARPRAERGHLAAP
jgi:hypothetical protein